MSEGFAPGNRIREISPDGADPNSSAWAGEHAPDAPDGRTTPFGSRHGRRFVSSTTGAPTMDAATAAAAIPETPAGLDWAVPEDRAAEYDVKAPPRKGRKAERAYRDLMEARRREEAQRVAIEADVERRGVAGFRDGPRHASLVAMSNPAYAPSKVYETIDPAPPERRKPWYRRLVVIIPVAVVLIAGLIAGIGIPAAAQARATAQANDAARQFLQDLAEYQSAWDTDNIAALTAAHTSAGLGESTNALQQPADAQVLLTEECTVLAGATRAADQLSSNPPPSLAVLSSASFSASYREAQQVDARFAGERLAAQTMLSAISATLGPLSGFCTNFQSGVAIENEAALRDAQELEPLRTVPAGGTMQVGGQTIQCGEASGCVDYGDEDARATYAATWHSIQEERMVALVTHYRDACWLEVLRPYCTLMSDAWDRAKGGLSTISSAMGSEKPTTDPTQNLFPRWDQALAEQALAFQAVADDAKLEAGSIDAVVLTDLDSGWESRMLFRLVTSYETHLSVATEDYLDLVDI